MADIPAIETHYNGYRFRSRLEARWAVYFDALGVTYQYELEGYKMPSGACYLPEITDVRVQRVADISWQDSAAEGVAAYGKRRCPGCHDDGTCSAPHEPGGPCTTFVAGYVEEFRRLWDQINGAGAWERNDLVWCISFRRPKGGG